MARESLKDSAKESSTAGAAGTGRARARSVSRDNKGTTTSTRKSTTSPGAQTGAKSPKLTPMISKIDSKESKDYDSSLENTITNTNSSSTVSSSSDLNFTTGAGMSILNSNGDILDQINCLIKHPGFMIVLLLLSFLLVPFYQHFSSLNQLDSTEIQNMITNSVDHKLKTFNVQLQGTGSQSIIDSNITSSDSITNSTKQLFENIESSQSQLTSTQMDQQLKLENIDVQITGVQTEFEDLKGSVKSDIQNVNEEIVRMKKEVELSNSKFEALQDRVNNVESLLKQTEESLTKLSKQKTDTVTQSQSQGQTTQASTSVSSSSSSSMSLPPTLFQSIRSELTTKLTEDTQKLIKKEILSLKTEIHDELSNGRSDSGGLWYKEQGVGEISESDFITYKPLSSLGLNWALKSLGATISSSSPPRNHDQNLLLRQGLQAVNSFVNNLNIAKQQFQLLSPEGVSKLNLYVSEYPEVLIGSGVIVPGEAFSMLIEGKNATNSGSNVTTVNTVDSDSESDKVNKVNNRPSAFFDLTLGLQLKKVTHIAIRHTTKAMTVNPKSAPREFRVSKIDSDSESDLTKSISKSESDSNTDSKSSSKNFVYDGKELGLQVFRLASKSGEADSSDFQNVRSLRFEFFDSYGAVDRGVPFVSLYRVEVYGEN